MKNVDMAKVKNVLRASGSLNKTEALRATYEIAQAVQVPLRQAVLSGDILFNIFETIKLDKNASPEFQLDFLTPGTEKDFVAYTIPNHGYIPQRSVEGDYVMVPIFEIGASIDWNLKYARDARWDMVKRALEVMRAQFVKKFNDDGWHVILNAGVDRNIVVIDSDASAGQFTKRLVSLLQAVMRRNGGGNSTSINRGLLTDLFISPEAMECIRNWNVSSVDPTTQREIFITPGQEGLSNIFGVNLHTLDELGEGQEYQLYFENELSGTLPGSDVEIVVGLDLSKNDAFIMPVREEVSVFADDSLHRQRRAGLYGWASQGMACLDNRRVLLGAC